MSDDRDDSASASSISSADLRAALQQRQSQSLGEQLRASTAGSARAWVERSRALPPRPQQVEKKSAIKTAAVAVYNADSLSGVHVRHDLADFDRQEEDEQLILTLADGHVLNGVDELESELLTSRDRLRVNLERRAGKAVRASPFEQVEASVLSKYDDDDSLPPRKEGLVLGRDGRYDRAQHEQRQQLKRDEMIREGLEAGDAPLGKMQRYDLSDSDSAPRLESDFQPVKFRKNRRTKTEREPSLPASSSSSSSSASFAFAPPPLSAHDVSTNSSSTGWLAALISESAAETGANFGSRKPPVSSASGPADTRQSLDRRRQLGFLAALNESNLQTTRRAEADRVQVHSLDTMISEVDEESDTLAQSLALARRGSAAAKPWTSASIVSASPSLVNSASNEKSTLSEKSIADRARALVQRIKQEDESKTEHAVRELSSASAQASSDEIGNQGQGDVQAGDQSGGIVFSSASSFSTGLALDTEDADDRGRKRVLAVKQEPLNNRHATTVVPAALKAMPEDHISAKTELREEVEEGEMIEEQVDDKAGMRASCLLEADSIQSAAGGGDRNHSASANGNASSTFSISSSAAAPVSQAPSSLSDDKSSGDDNDDEDQEPIVGDGVASTLELARRRAYLQPLSQQRTKLDSSVKYDVLGRPMSLKEQFRLISHQFHGQLPGITKRDKRLKTIRKEQDQARRERLGMDRASLLQKTQERLELPYLVLEGAGKAALAAALTKEAATSLTAPASQAQSSISPDAKSTKRRMEQAQATRTQSNRRKKVTDAC